MVGRAQLRCANSWMEEIAMAPMKYLIALVASLYLVAMGTGAVIDRVANSTKDPRTQDVAESSLDESTIEALLLSGADPTNLFEPTAAGKPHEPLCFSGQLEVASENHSSLDGAHFVSRKFEGHTYIALLTNPPVYLHQDEHQAVSATHLDSLPGELYPQMGQIVNQKESCTERSLYISRID